MALTFCLIQRAFALRKQLGRKFRAQKSLRSLRFFLCWRSRDAIFRFTTMKRIQPASGRKLTVLSLAAATYFMVSGGPYGIEELVQDSGYKLALVILFLTPLVWALPTGLMVGELSAAMPKEGGFYVWVRRAMDLSGDSRKPGCRWPPASSIWPCIPACSWPTWESSVWAITLLCRSMATAA